MGKMVVVEDLLHHRNAGLELEVVIQAGSSVRKILRPEVHRPGLSLAGFLKKFVPDRVLVFGTNEVLYLQELPIKTQKQRLEAVIADDTPVVIVAGNNQMPKKLLEVCEEKSVPLMQTPKPTMAFLSHLTFVLSSEFAPSMTCHGTFIEAFGVGVLIQGDSSIGKSEAALGLIERGHRLISDDIVKLSLRKDSVIEGFGPELNKHMMEIRGIGIINVAHLYGAVCVRSSKSLDLIVKLEMWDDQAFYDRIGLDEKFTEMLGVNIPYHILPVKPGRDVVLLIETIVLNHRLKMMGYHSAREFNMKLLETIARKQQDNEVHAKS